MNGKEWSPMHIRLLELLIPIGCTHALISKITGHCEDTIQRRAAALGLRPHHGVARYGAWEDLSPHTLEAIKSLTSKVGTPAHGEP